MSYSAKIICDSISETGKRLTTFEITFPRMVLAEFNTHRMFSRNSASSRAIPFKKQIQRIVDNPFIPERFPIDGSGMQPNSYVDKDHSLDYNHASEAWMEARDAALDSACNLYSSLVIKNLFEDWDWQNSDKPEPAIHKQIVNRLLEPFMWHTVICTATEFDNFFKLRTNGQAQYEIRRIADLMYEAYHAWDDIESEVMLSLKSPDFKNWEAVKPKELKQGEWHLPFISGEDENLIIDYIESGKNKELYDDWYSGNTIDQREAILKCKKEVSVARCARVSYLTHDGKRDIEKDLELFEKLRTSGHWSPFEHVATPHFIDEKFVRITTKILEDYPELGIPQTDLRSGNFIGWKQFRKEFQDENCTHFRKEI